MQRSDAILLFIEKERNETSIFPSKAYDSNAVFEVTSNAVSEVPYEFKIFTE